MLMRFTLNAPEYAGVKGLVNCGSTIVDLGSDLTDGVYETHAPVEQQMLAELRGKNGRVFKSELVNPDGSTQAVALEPIPEKTVGRNPAEVAAQLELAAQRKGPQAPDKSGYDALPDAELKTLIENHGLPVPTDANHAELVEILDSADESQTKE